MKRIILICITIVGLTASSGLFAQKRATRQVRQVEAVIEQFKNALITPNEAQLRALTYPDLKYAHSTGLVQNQQEFIDRLISGKSDFLQIEYTHQTIDIIGKTATVRHLLSAKTFDSKVPGHIDLEILLVFVKHHGKWRLLARQAVKPYKGE
ncbi:MAG TPA: nuclear transport factor 2 family protein [Arachidicoccus soli]|uniref:Nuclear transport factor 2 family protein n=1 Tax=Arachidicoccus soli TaxID=2341117 RepID=A0A386HML7_9BACT|nr:nuclear transport factor 2 family protein [Arachidicoccus soli]AYD47035.1 nuclear transport factor 2 family protein [Arachidicoccus soli]HEU0227944.1 nuclear transport factor 2 family protein [Arachidicoccus soli]